MVREDVNGLIRRSMLMQYTREFIKKRKQEIKNFIKKEKFRTGWLELPELKLRINLKPNQFYRLETAKDIFQREQEIYEEYSQKDVKISHSSYSRLNGLCIPLHNLNLDQRCQVNIILIKADLKEPTKTYVFGHENGHFIFNMGLKDQFYNEYNVPDRIREQILDTEDFGMFCGNIAMANAGYILSKIKSVSPSPALLEKEQKARSLVMEILPDQFYHELFNRNL